MSMKNITPTKLNFDNSFEILSKSRKSLHNRRTLSSALDLSSKNLHHKSFSSQFSSLSDDLQQEIQKIKEEVDARCLEQKQRDAMFESVFGIDCSMQTDDIHVEPASKIDEMEEKQGFFFVCKKWICGCFKLVK